MIVQGKNIKSVKEFIDAIETGLQEWGSGVRPWFRGESGSDPKLRPKIFDYEFNQENYLLQSFKRKARGLGNVPPRDNDDEWLFLAQHYGVPTRLLDWTEGALNALYFSINKGQGNFRVYMLNPRKLNQGAGVYTYDLNYPLTDAKNSLAYLYIQNAWQNRIPLKERKKEIEEAIQKVSGSDPVDDKEIKELKLKLRQLNIPIAFPARYQDTRMISQKSCFTIHGHDEKSIMLILDENSIERDEVLIEYNIEIYDQDGKIEEHKRNDILKTLNILGVSAASIFPDLDHLAKDLLFDAENFGIPKKLDSPIILPIPSQPVLIGKYSPTKMHIQVTP